jgi:hypothetical protein
MMAAMNCCACWTEQDLAGASNDHMQTTFHSTPCMCCWPYSLPATLGGRNGDGQRIENLN